MKKRILIWGLILILISAVLLGCGKADRLAASGNTEINIPFKCVYSGFLINYTDKLEQGFLPRKDIIFSTKEQWEAFKKQYLQYNSAINYVFNYSIDFTKQSLIYHPIVSAKQGVYSTASKVTKITKHNNELKYDLENLDVSVSSLHNTDFLFASIIAVDKKYIEN
ncbi:hypothetical protein HMPREF1982_01797 [Clostridiales bacterium oral taxon 876 str. F0540]|nr:hypothetical protein HMPREF1982_01797 [Clostridiales bacterium oral taxon 876 str. F0540]